MSTTQTPIRLAFKIISLSCLALILISIVMVLPWRWFKPPTSAFMFVDNLTNDRKVDYVWVSLQNMASCMGIAAVAAEDQKFPDHYGFDLDSIADALKDPDGRPRGASTISQQVAKNLFLWNGRSYIRKGIEAWLTVLIETFWPKRRILEIYLNIAEFGPGVFGVGAASILLRDVYPLELTSFDCAVLAAVLPNPKTMSAAEPSAYVQKRASEIQMQINHLGGASYLDRL